MTSDPFSGSDPFGGESSDQSAFTSSVSAGKFDCTMKTGSSVSKALAEEAAATVEAKKSSSKNDLFSGEDSFAATSSFDTNKGTSQDDFFSFSVKQVNLSSSSTIF